MSFIPIYTKQERPITLPVYNAWWVCPPCELKEEPYCHTQYPWFGECGATEEYFEQSEDLK